MNPVRAFLLLILIALCSGMRVPLRTSKRSESNKNSPPDQQSPYFSSTTTARTSLDQAATLASSRKKIGVLGIPFRYGQRKLGVEEAPAFIRETGVFQNLSALGYQVQDYGDVQVAGTPNLNASHMDQHDMVAKTNKNVRDAVARILSTGSVSVNLGGDHTISIGTVIAHAEAVSSGVALIWIDAHGDINTARTNPTGDMHGMPVAFLLHEMARYVVKPTSFDWIQPCVHKENFAYIGLRALGPYERYFMDVLGITRYSMAEVDRLGIRKIIHQVLKEINPNGTKSLHISVDIDTIDELIAPSTGTPVIGGLTMREALVIAEETYKSGQLRVLDLTEINPRLGTERDAKRTVKCGADLIRAFFGKERQGDLPLAIDPWVIDINNTLGRA